MEWLTKAPCLKVNPDAFWSDDPSEQREARKFCNTHCNFVQECLEYALRCEKDLRVDERHGTFGGKSPHSRYRIQLKRGTSNLCRNKLHSMTGDNVAITTAGTRRCRACRAAAAK